MGHSQGIALHFSLNKWGEASETSRTLTIWTTTLGDCYMKSATNVILFLYRSVALVALYGVLAGVLIYVGTLGFYTVNSTWIAPAAVAPTDTNSLGFSDKLVASQNAVDILRLDIKRQDLSLAEYQSQRAALMSLKPALLKAITLKHQQDRGIGRSLAKLVDVKFSDNERTSRLVAEGSTQEESIRKDLAAHLITKGAAAQEELQLNQSRNELTEGQISSTVLQGTVLEKTTSTMADADALTKQVDLQSKLATLNVQIQVALQESASDKEQINRILQATDVASGTPYFVSASGTAAMYLAFVPYQNQRSVTIGAPVYDCYLNFVACRHVGTIKRVFQNEERVPNPIFTTDMRGFLVQLDLEDSSVVRSKTLFVGGKPLWI